MENNGFQSAVEEQLRREFPDIPVKGYHTGSEKADEQLGLPGLAMALERGEWIIPAGGTPHGGGCTCAYCAWLRELQLYPACEHSDTIMAMWFAAHAAREDQSHQLPPGLFPNAEQAAELLTIFRKRPYGAELGASPRELHRERRSLFRDHY